MENLEKKLTKRFEDIINKQFKEHEVIQKELEKERKEMFENLQKIITKLISDNNVLINQRLDTISNDINELKASIELTDNVVKNQAKDIKELKTKSKIIINNQASINNLEKSASSINEKLIDLENRSRRNNLRIDGIPEHVNETWKDCEEKVKVLLKNKLKLKDDIQIERAHRTGKENQGRPRTIVFKLLSYKDKALIMSCGKRLAGSGIYINEDFAKETVEKRKKLWEEVKKYRRDGKYAILQYDKVIVRNKRPNIQA